jgi:hypothetical protein
MDVQSGLERRAGGLPGGSAGKQTDRQILGSVRFGRDRGGQIEGRDRGTET